MNKIIVSTVALALAFTSCKTKHDLAYFQDLNDSQQGVLKTLPHTNTIEPENELIITVKSEVPSASAQFNLPYTNPATIGTTQTNTTPQLQTYEVYPDGNIDFPVLGKIHAAGMTTFELKEYLTKRISEYVKDPVVTVTLRGYKISVLGEVTSPRTLYTQADRYSVIDALADCGGLTDFGRRDNVMVMRRNANNDIEYGRLDMRSSDITQSPYFWLKNNDVIVVEPNNIKQDNSKVNQNNQYKLTVISSIVGVVSVVASLVIALTVK